MPSFRSLWRKVSLVGAAGLLVAVAGSTPVLAQATDDTCATVVELAQSGRLSEAVDLAATAPDGCRGAVIQQIDALRGEAAQRLSYAQRAERNAGEEIDGTERAKLAALYGRVLDVDSGNEVAAERLAAITNGEEASGGDGDGGWLSESWKTFSGFLGDIFFFLVVLGLFLAAWVFTRPRRLVVRAAEGEGGPAFSAALRSRLTEMRDLDPSVNLPLATVVTEPPSAEVPKLADVEQRLAAFDWFVRKALRGRELRLTPTLLHGREPGVSLEMESGGPVARDTIRLNPVPRPAIDPNEAAERLVAPALAWVLARWPNPSAPSLPRAAVGTASWTAFANHLEGLDHFRAGRVPEARASFQRAVNEDSTYLLARYNRAAMAATLERDNIAVLEDLVREIEEVLQGMAGGPVPPAVSADEMQAAATPVPVAAQQLDVNWLRAVYTSAAIRMNGVAIADAEDKDLALRWTREARSRAALVAHSALRARLAEPGGGERSRLLEAMVDAGSMLAVAAIEHRAVLRTGEGPRLAMGSSLLAALDATVRYSEPSHVPGGPSLASLPEPEPATGTPVPTPVDSAVVLVKALIDHRGGLPFLAPHALYNLACLFSLQVESTPVGITLPAWTEGDLDAIVGVKTPLDAAFELLGLATLDPALRAKAWRDPTLARLRVDSTRFVNAVGPDPTLGEVDVRESEPTAASPIAPNGAGTIPIATI